MLKMFSFQFLWIFASFWTWLFATRFSLQETLQTFKSFTTSELGNLVHVTTSQRRSTYGSGLPVWYWLIPIKVHLWAQGFLTKSQIWAQGILNMILPRVLSLVTYYGTGLHRSKLHQQW